MTSLNFTDRYHNENSAPINKSSMALDSGYAGSGFKVDVYKKGVHETLKPQS
jgi:hypothetical protein